MSQLATQGPLNLTPAPYKRIRNATESILTKTGGAIKPIAFARIFLGYLNSFYPSKMNKLKARNLAEVFAALLNESYLMTSEYNGQDSREWFYMTNSKWDKYLLVRKNIKKYLKLLAHMKYISTYIGKHPLKKGSKITFYKVNAEAMENLANEIAFYKC